MATAAGLALLRPLAASAATALREEGTHLPAVLTVAVTASGITAGPALGLATGLLMLDLTRASRPR